MAGVKANNSIETATKIDIFRRSRTIRGTVSSSNRVDFYRFEVKRVTRLNSIGVTLRGLDDDANLALLNSRGGVVAASRYLGDKSDIISGAIAPGTYYLRVSRVEDSTDYKLTAVVTPIASSGKYPITRQNTNFTVEELDTAKRINALGRTRKIEGSVSKGNKQDFYRIDLKDPARISLTLRDLDANLDVDLINGQGQLISRSAYLGKVSEVIAPKRSFSAGTYYIRVYTRGGNSSYDLYLTAITDTTRSNPNTGGTTPTLVSNINPRGLSSNPTDLVNVNGRLFFAATDTTGGTELWTSDGTNSGTRRVADINPGTASSNPTDLVVSGGVLYFAANDGTNGIELWRSDGTASGTQRVSDINPGAASSSPSDLYDFNGQVYFAANNGTNGKELWRSGGTAATTELVADINPGQGSSNPNNFVSFNNVLYFAADDNRVGNELWRFDGNATSLFRDIVIGAAGSNPRDLAVFNNNLYFSANDATNGQELWRSDGTVSGTNLFIDINNGSASSNPTDLVAVGTRLYFAANDGIRGNELWSTDGTTTGTALLRDIRVGADSSNPADLVNVDASGRLYFTAENSVNGRQIYRSDGTLTGTVLVTGSALNTLNPTDLVAIGNTLFFAATISETGTELFSIPA
ncbi:MAG TPA: ELWxxDGT repeat protein [Crinalium sp.]